MPHRVSKFAILVIELGKANSPTVQEMLINEIFHFQALTDWSKAWNYINHKSSPNPDLIIINSNIVGKSAVGITIEQIISAILHRKSWNGIPTMLIRKRADLAMDQFRKDENICKHLSTPFEHEDFLNSVYTLIKQSIDKHIADVNNQHIQLSKRFQILEAMVKKNVPLEKIKACLEKIKQETQKHFVFEESYMQAHHYPDFVTHHQNHQALIKLLDHTMEIFQNLSASQLLEFLQNLRADIYGDINDDKEYILYLKGIHQEIDSEIQKYLSLA